MMSPLVLDTGPLSHFAKQQWLGVLRAIVNGRVAMIPDAVEAELRAGVSAHPHLRFVLALASINGGIAVVDDSAARKVADRYGVEHIGTLGCCARASVQGC